jgi:hypothetical protein
MLKMLKFAEILCLAACDNTRMLAFLSALRNKIISSLDLKFLRGSYILFTHERRLDLTT